MNASARIPDVSRGHRPTRDAASIPPPSQAEQVAQLAAEIDSRLWALARVTPCAEATTARHLRLHGLIAYQPTKSEERRASRYTRRLVTVERRALPGYLLVGMDADRPQWHRLFGAPHVSGVIGSARAAQMLGRVIAQWCAGLSDQADVFEEGLRSEPLPAVGDRVRVSVPVDLGPAMELPGRVVALDGRSVTVLAQFFGSERRIVATLAQVARAQA